MGYTKLFSSIVTSTIWGSSDATRLVWITMLAIKDKHGEVDASVPGLARLARVSLEDCERALVELKSPDPHSRTADYEGRRIENIDGGWRLLNHDKYRDKMNEDDIRESNARRQREWRARQKEKESTVTESNTQSPTSDKQITHITHTDTDTDTDTDHIDEGVPSSHPVPGTGKRKAIDLKSIQAEIQAAWNAMASEHGLPKWATWNASRKKALRDRWTDAYWRNNWREAINRVPLTPWNLGQGERSTGWQANPVWFLRDKVVPDLMESNGAPKRKSTKTPDTRDPFVVRCVELQKQFPKKSKAEIVDMAEREGLT